MFSYIKSKKNDNKLKIKINDKDKLVKKVSNFSFNLSKEAEFYIKNNLVLFLIGLFLTYNYDYTLRLGYLPIILGNKLISNIEIITSSINNL